MLDDIFLEPKKEEKIKFVKLVLIGSGNLTKNLKS